MSIEQRNRPLTADGRPRKKVKRRQKERQNYRTKRTAELRSHKAAELQLTADH